MKINNTLITDNRSIELYKMFNKLKTMFDISSEYYKTTKAYDYFIEINEIINKYEDENVFDFIFIDIIRRDLQKYIPKSKIKEFYK